MLRYYFRLAWRIMKKQKVYSLINVLGLSIGICACLVIFLVASYEFSFDRFHKDGDRIFRIVGEVQRLNGDMEFANSVVPDVAGIQTAIPGFEAKTGIYHYDAAVKYIDDDGNVKTFNTDRSVVTSSDYFRIFSYEWLAGNSSAALAEPNSVVISEKKMKLYFGDIEPTSALNRTLVYNDSLAIKVTGVVRDWQQNTDLPYTDFISLATANHPFLKKEIPSTDWSSLRPHGTMAFVKLEKNTSEQKVNALLRRYLDKHAKAAFYGKLVKLELQSISDLHFAKTYNRGDDGDGFRKAYLPSLYMLIGIAIFILVLAVVNFVNLSTALSIRRTKEIGMRKVLGAGRKGLSLQLFTETFLFTLLAMILACAMIAPVLDFFKDYLPPGLHFDVTDTRIIFFLVVLAVVTTLFAGMYPAKVLSSLLPVLSLKGVASEPSSGNTSLRKGLIVFQFAVSLIFIVATLVINAQIDYMRTTDKGFKTDAIITINNWGGDQQKLRVLSQMIKKVPGVEDAILQSDAPMGFAERSGFFKYKGKREGETEAIIKTGDQNFIPFYDIDLIAGRNIGDGDSVREFVINEAFARAMEYDSPADAVGRMIYSADQTIPVVGVVRDFHMGSFHVPIRPMIIQHVPDWENSMAVSIASQNKSIDETKKIIGAIEVKWKEMFPERDFNMNFLDESIGWMFEREEQAAWLMNAAMIIAIFISCMGLFGLAMYTAERRTREIGIRKVLGASVADITVMLSRDFGMLVIAATVIASPVAWLLMNWWLQDFVYRISISLWIFIGAMFIALVIAMLTVSYQSVKAALANPVKNLRTE